MSGANFVSPDPAAPFWGFSLFGGVQARGVARNIFLDGSTFGRSPSVTREAFVYDLVAGVEVFNQAGFLVRRAGCIGRANTPRSRAPSRTTAR